MRDTLQFRNRSINSFFGILAITIVGGLAALYIIHIANDAPFANLVTASTYDIDTAL